MRVYVLVVGYLTGVDLKFGCPGNVCTDSEEVLGILQRPWGNRKRMTETVSKGDAGFSTSSFPPTRENLRHALLTEGRAITVWKVESKQGRWYAFKAAISFECEREPSDT